MYEYKCTLLRVIDGDTIDVDIDLGFKARLKELLPKKFTLVTHKDGKGKFGRILGEPLVDHPEYGKINVCDRMLEEGHARPYYGGTKVPWVILKNS